ncbi:MAG: NHL repeat-containing protein [Planctomycetales bacterium]
MLLRVFSILCLLCVTAGQLRAADLVYPISVAVAKDGAVYIADNKLPGIWKFSGGKLEEFARASDSNRTPLNAIRCVAVDPQGGVLAADSALREIFRVEAKNKFTPLTKGGIGLPSGIAIDADGTIFVSDLESHAIYKVPAKGGDPVKFADVKAPLGLAFDADKVLWVATRGKDQVVKVATDGKVTPVVTGRTLQFPQGIAVGTDKAVYVSDSYGKAIWKIPAGGQPAKWAAEGLKGPLGIAFQGTNLIVADPQLPALLSVDPAGKVSSLSGTKP